MPPERLSSEDRRRVAPGKYDPRPMGVWINYMVDRFDQQAAWPDADDKRVWNQVKVWIAFHESDRDVIRLNARWRNQVRAYYVDPVAPLIDDAFASAIFGRKPNVTAADPADKQLEADLIRGNNLGRKCQREAKRQSSEGEVWWRITSEPDRDKCPIVEFRSRLDVIPHFSKQILRAVTFIDELDPKMTDGEQAVWRHFEIHDDEHIENVLYYGSHDTIGERQPLTAHPQTEDLAERIAHELPRMPAGRILNLEGVDVFYGISNYSRIEDHLYGLNELLAIFHENVRLTLKKRVVVPASAVDESGTIDASQEVIVNETLDDRLGKDQAGASSLFNVLEYQSNIEEVIKAQNAEAEAALTRIGITPAFVGMTTDQSEGRAVTGTALRLRLIPTTNAAEDRASYWDDELPEIVTLLQLLDAREPFDANRLADDGSPVMGGFGRPWSMPEQAPAIARGSSLPEDPVEESEVHATRVSASIESRYQAIRELHPDWSEDQIAEEIGRIQDDLQTPGAGALGGLFSTGRTPAKVPGVQ